MLEYYLDDNFKLGQLRASPAGKNIDSFADWLHSAGYRRRPAQLLLRGAAHLAYWASIHRVQIGQLDQELLEAFARHLATCTCTHTPFMVGPPITRKVQSALSSICRVGVSCRL